MLGFFLSAPRRSIKCTYQFLSTRLEEFALLESTVPYAMLDRWIVHDDILILLETDFVDVEAF